MPSPATSRIAATVLLVAASAVGAAAACGGAGTVRGPRVTGQPVDVEVPLLDGGNLVFASLRGRPVVVHFFTTWSLAAQIDLKELARVEGRAVVVGVALDPDGRALVVPWRVATGARHDLALVTDALLAGATPFGRVQTVPTTFVLDAKGRIVWRHEGGLVPGALEEIVRRLGGTGSAH